MTVLNLLRRGRHWVLVVRVVAASIVESVLFWAHQLLGAVVVQRRTYSILKRNVSSRDPGHRSDCQRKFAHFPRQCGAHHYLAVARVEF